MTDKRRHQNRAAQRKYRAKRKEQLAHLEQQISTLTDRTTTTTTATQGPKLIEEVVLPHQNNVPESTTQSKKTSTTSDNNNTIIVVPQQQHASNPTPTSVDDASSPPQPSSSTTTAPHDEPQNTNNNNTSSMTALMRLLSADAENDAESLMRFALREQFDVSKVLLAGLRALKAESERTSIAPLTRDNGVDWRPELWPSSSSSFNNLSTHILPDPLMNGILLRRQAPLEVFYHNCRQIGLAFEEMALPTCRSPWYSPPLHGPQHNNTQILHLDSVPPDLKPTPAQLTIAHHPFWDTIPFPWIRERIITLSALEPPPFQWHELKADILRGGMVCWRSRAREEGVPWDRRSWEVRPWFGRKWGWLIEEQGRVEQQSRWWRAMQGNEY
ncbi:hypothetical protein DM02DRAFT_603799 [Periconia macrospinosa]|uniref:BZIP domain-containing protein n=1 Tax=Periconia macrospinosa TaxID=97972 RepID=A0A2V1D6B7_9PLEO|nr:hypothetical protein DM02DRAFT_603799 [Periconia macrospinosa]